MKSNNAPKDLPDNVNMVIIIDKEKLPKNVIKILEENLPKNVKEQTEQQPELSQEKIKGKMEDTQLKDKQDGIDNKLFAIQTGTVIGNIYTGAIYKKDEDSYINIKDLGEPAK